jgi:hypothetical protein
MENITHFLLILQQDIWCQEIISHHIQDFGAIYQPIFHIFGNFMQIR